jgi:hypothetical protein
MRKLLLGFAILIFGCIAWAADSAAPALAATVNGKVLEVKDVDNYTYLRLKMQDGEVWAAVNKAPMKIGADITIENATVMKNFESKTLNMTFDRIVFGSIAAHGASPPSAPVDMAAMHADMAKPVDVGTINVIKASGPDGRTVAEINARKADLKGKTVVVRGKVVKFTPEVLGKNWIHLRDGSGSAADGSNDILVTTLDETKIGDVVLVKGVVQTDRDLGSGYSYKVLIEEARLQK